MRMKGAREHLRSVVARSFSPAARVIVIDGLADLELMISWRLGEDLERPAKRSKTIRVTLETEALEEYAAGSVEERRCADERLGRHLSERLTQFDPQHSAPVGQEPPIERWVIDSVALLGSGG